MYRLRSSPDELSFLRNKYLRTRTLFRTSRSINRLRAALNNFVRPFGDLSSARHAVRFNLICKRCRSHGDDLSFALKMIRSFDATRSAAAKGAVRAAKRMALRIHHGLVKGKSKRKAGSWATQSYVSAVLGPSECKSYCRRIIVLNRRRSMGSRLIKPVISSLEEAIHKISSCNWKSSQWVHQRSRAPPRLCWRSTADCRLAFTCPLGTVVRPLHGTCLLRTRW